MRTLYQIALTTSVLASLSFATLGANAEASVAHGRAHAHAPAALKSSTISGGFLKTGTASDPDFASASSMKRGSIRAGSRQAKSRKGTTLAVGSRRSQIGTASFYHP